MQLNIFNTFKNVLKRMNFQTLENRINDNVESLPTDMRGFKKDELLKLILYCPPDVTLREYIEKIKPKLRSKRYIEFLNYIMNTNIIIDEKYYEEVLEIFNKCYTY